MRVSLRHVYRLKNNLIKDGPEGLISKKVGAPSNHQWDQGQIKLVLAFIMLEIFYHKTNPIGFRARG